MTNKLGVTSLITGVALIASGIITGTAFANEPAAVNITDGNNVNNAHAVDTHETVASQAQKKADEANERVNETTEAYNNASIAHANAKTALEIAQKNADNATTANIMKAKNDVNAKQSAVNDLKTQINKATADKSTLTDEQNEAQKNVDIARDYIKNTIDPALSEAHRNMIDARSNAAIAEHSLEILENDKTTNEYKQAENIYNEAVNKRTEAENVYETAKTNAADADLKYRNLVDEFNKIHTSLTEKDSEITKLTDAYNNAVIELNDAKDNYNVLINADAELIRVKKNYDDTDKQLTDALITMNTAVSDHEKALKNLETVKQQQVINDALNNASKNDDTISNNTDSSSNANGNGNANANSVNANKNATNALVNKSADDFSADYNANKTSAASETASGSSEDNLAKTGANVSMITIISALMLMGGAGALMITHHMKTDDTLDTIIK